MVFEFAARFSTLAGAGRLAELEQQIPALTLGFSTGLFTSAFIRGVTSHADRCLTARALAKARQQGPKPSRIPRPAAPKGGISPEFLSFCDRLLKANELWRQEKVQKQAQLAEDAASLNAVKNRLVTKQADLILQQISVEEQGASVQMSETRLGQKKAILAEQQAYLDEREVNLGKQRVELAKASNSLDQRRADLDEKGDSISANAFKNLTERLHLHDSLQSKADELDALQAKHKELQELHAAYEDLQRQYVKNKDDELSALKAKYRKLRSRHAKLHSELDEVCSVAAEVLADYDAEVERAAKYKAADIKRDSMVRSLVDGIISDLGLARRELETEKAGRAKDREEHEMKIREIHGDWHKDYRKLMHEVEQLRLARSASLVEQEVSTAFEDAMLESLRESRAKEAQIVSQQEDALDALSDDHALQMSPALSDMSFTTMYGGICVADSVVDPVSTTPCMSLASLCDNSFISVDEFLPRDRPPTTEILFELHSARRELEVLKATQATERETHQKEIREIHGDWLKDYRKLARENEQLRLARSASLVEQELSTAFEDSLFRRLRKINRKLGDAERAVEARSTEPGHHPSDVTTRNTCSSAGSPTSMRPLSATFAFRFRASPIASGAGSPFALASNGATAGTTRAPQTQCSPSSPFSFSFPRNCKPDCSGVGPESRFRSAKRIKIDFHATASTTRAPQTQGSPSAPFRFTYPLPSCEGDRNGVELGSRLRAVKRIKVDFDT